MEDDDQSTRQVEELRRLVKDVLAPAYNNFDQSESDALRTAILASGGASQELKDKGRLRKVAQERRVLLAFLAHMREDERLVQGRLDDVVQGRHDSAIGLHRIYHRFKALVPPALWKLYLEDPSDTEAAELRRLAEPSTAASCDAPKMLLHRERGRLPIGMATLAKLVISPLCHAVSFAIPTEAALEAIAEHAPLIECGAGTGYWSALLQQRGIDVIAYDSHPVALGSTTNHFFSGTPFCEVRAGSFGEMFELGSSAAGCSSSSSSSSSSHAVCGRENAARALLLIWPNNPDDVDNAHLQTVSSGSLVPPKPPIWDADCLHAYHAAGGATVIFIGEREEMVRGTLAAGARPECGSSASRRFQAMLAERFEQVRRLSMPTWAFNADDLTIWTRRAPPREVSLNQSPVAVA